MVFLRGWIRIRSISDRIRNPVNSCWGGDYGALPYLLITLLEKKSGVDWRNFGVRRQKMSGLTTSTSLQINLEINIYSSNMHKSDNVSYDYKNNKPSLIKLIKITIFIIYCSPLPLFYPISLCSYLTLNIKFSTYMYVGANFLSAYSYWFLIIGCLKALFLLVFCLPITRQLLYVINMFTQ